MSTTYDESRSRLSSEALMQWIETKMNGSLTQIPGIGPASAKTLSQDGVTSAYQLFGKYMMFRGPNISSSDHRDLFCSYLKEDAGLPTNYIQTVTQAISEKVNVGFFVPCSVNEQLSVKSASRITEEKMCEFISRQLTGDLKDDFHGVGPKTVEKMADHDVYNSWQLMGQFLMTMDEVEASTEPANSADAFEAWLADTGTAASFRAAVVVQCVERLKAGLWLPGDMDLHLVERLNDLAVSSS